MKNDKNKKIYSKLFKSYIGKINHKEIDKIVLARIKTFSKNKHLSKKNIITRLDPKCTNFLFEFDEENIFLGSTPELLINKKGKNFSTEALAGSIAKTNITHNDNQLNKFMNDDKEISEHNFVIKHIEENLNNYIKKISIGDRELKILDHIYHLRTPIKGSLKSNINIIELLFNLYPTPAVLGIPKIPCLKLIEKYEPFDRGWYSGCIGWFDLKGDGRFDVAIRSGLIKENQIHLFAGGGIIKDSKESKEWNETEVKFQHLLSKLN